MRKLLTTVLLLVTFTGAFAQKLDDIREKIDKKKYDEAREKVDKTLADPKGAANADAWFYKAVVYHNLAKANPADSTLPLAALEAAEKYLSMDAANGKKMLLSTLENHATLVNIYQDYFNLGLADFKKQQYSSALNNFQRTLRSFDLLKNYNITSMKFDTTSTIYAAFSAHNAKDYPAAEKYYSQIVNARIPDTTFIDAYYFLIGYNLSQKKDTGAARNYLDISKQVFPARNWLEYEYSFLSNDKEKRVGQLQDLAGKYPDDAALALEYAIALYNWTFVYETKPTDYEARKVKTKAQLETALKLDPNSPMGNFIMSQYANNEIGDLEEEIRLVKGNAPAEAAKRKDLRARIDQKYEDMLVYSQKSYDIYGAETTMKAQDKVNYRKSINQLIDYYGRKNNTERVNFYTDKLKQIK